MVKTTVDGIKGKLQVEVVIRLPGIVIILPVPSALSAVLPRVEVRNARLLIDVLHDLPEYKARLL